MVTEGRSGAALRLETTVQDSCVSISLLPLGERFDASSMFVPSLKPRLWLSSGRCCGSSVSSKIPYRFLLRLITST